MSRPLIAQTGLDPKNVDVVLVNDPSINAFVAGGQAVYVNSGLINAADNASHGEARERLQAMRAARDPRLGDAC